MKIKSLIGRTFISAFLFLVMAGLSYGQKPRTCIDELLTNPEYSNDKKFMNEVNTMRRQGIPDKEIFDRLNAQAEKHNKEVMKAGNAQFIKDYIINKGVKTGKGLSPNSYTCHADSLGILSANSMGNWKGFTQGWCNTAGCAVAGWTPVVLPCVNCIGNASGGVNNISIAPPPASEPCADIIGQPINLPSPYGGSQSIQIGNNNISAQQDRITYTFRVGPSDVSFNYQYACILENPAHLPANQPFFDFVILDSIGDTVACSYQHYIAAPNLPGWQTSNNSNPLCDPYSGGGFPIYYKPWSVVGVNLTGYVGHPVTVICTVSDCSQCGHFGITYLDFACTSLNAGQYCTGDTATTLVAPYDPSFIYQWSTGATTSSITVNPNNYLPPNDTITVHVTQANSLCPFDFTFIITQTKINPGFKDSIHCNMVYFTDTTTISGGTISSWNWSFPGGTPSSYSGQSPPPVVYPYASGTYTASLGVVSQAGCTATSASIPIVISIPIISASPNVSLCAGSATICASGGVSYTWSTAQTTTCIVVTPANPTTYTVVGADANGCTNAATVSVVLGAAPTVSICCPSTLCLGRGSAHLVATGTSGVSYSWSPGTGLSCTTCPNPTATPGFSNTYTVYVKDANGCTAAATTTVMVGSIPFVSANAKDTICPGYNAQLLANTSNGLSPYTYYWTPTIGLSNPNISNPVATPVTSTVYTVTVTDANGCTDDTITSVMVGTKPSAALAKWTPILSCDGYTIPLGAQGSSNAISYYWNFGDGTSSTLQNPTHSYPFNGTYVITLVVFNPPCRDSADTTVVIGDLSGLMNLEPANVFTPNGDGINDCFHPAFKLINIPANWNADTLTATLSQCIYLEVYDRWGIKMFETTAAEKCWNGKTKSGGEAKEGTYFYISKMGNLTLRGYVTLLRDKN